jgi:diguanylate cyclase (GGDEF)-like protein
VRWPSRAEPTLQVSRAAADGFSTLVRDRRKLVLRSLCRHQLGPVLGASPFARYWWAVVTVGAVVTGLTFRGFGLEAAAALDVAFWVVVAFVVLGEVRPVIASIRLDPAGVNLATAFHFAVLLAWGFNAALITILLGTVVGELVRRKAAFRLLFNLAQYILSYLAAWGVMVLAGWNTSALEPAALQPRDLPVIVLAAGAYHLTNLAVVGTAVALSSGVPVRQGITEGFLWHTVTTLGMMTLSPLIVVVLATNWGFLPLLLVPLYLVWATAKLALEREERSMTDDLTGLANRARLTDLVNALGEGPAEQRVALALLDLDRFKEVNDTLGHTTGDHLLRAVAARLAHACRDGDVVARLGGDEFALLIEIDGRLEAERALTRITDAIRAPFEVGGIVLEVELSAGVAVFPDHGTELETLLRRADLAMYEAKRRGETVVSFESELDQRTPGRLSLLADLRRGLHAGELVLAYQPQVDARTGAVLGVEALVRWEHPERGLLLPGAFLPEAQHTAVMREVTVHVLETALAQLARWAAGGHPWPVSVNTSLHDLADQGFADRVADGLARHGLAPGLLCLEITEQALVSDPSRVLLTLEKLHGMGIRLSLDDFGTGHASLTRLKRLAVDEVKIDRQFVVDLASGDPADRAIVRSVIDLARACGLRTVAEGVETDGQREALVELGCDAIQGWLFAAAMPAADLEAWVTAHPARDGDHLLPSTSSAGQR